LVRCNDLETNDWTDAKYEENETLR
jgi:hypothetical protein